MSRTATPDDPAIGAPIAGQELAAADAQSSSGRRRWKPDLVESLHDWLYCSEPTIGEIEEKLVELEPKHGHAVYSELIHLLSHLRFEPDDARRHWSSIVKHRHEMETKLGQSVDPRVALLSYFLDVRRELQSPKIIELKLYEETRDSAYRDALTGLANYRLFSEYLDHELLRSQRHRAPVTLAMMDVDNFKTYNDRNGHEAGNEVLKTIAQLLSESLRKVDVAARYGGEEFALILPLTSKCGAQLVAERIRRRIEAHAFPDQERQPLGRLTVSLGLATYPGDAPDADQLVRRADQALYGAKSNGKNQVQLYGESRRSYRRIKASLDGRFCVLTPDNHPLTTVDVGEGGLKFVADRTLPIGSLIDVSLMLPDSQEEIITAGRVVRGEMTTQGTYETAVRITEITPEDRIKLGRYIDLMEVTDDE